MIIVRIKAVSECMRIRRAAVVYVMDKNQVVSLLDCPHPLKKFKEATIEDGFMTVFDKKEYLSFDQEVFFYKYATVDTGNSKEQEASALGAVLISLDDTTVQLFIEDVKNHCILDQWNGEYEYLIGLYYEYEKKNIEEAKLWYQKAIDKRFIFEMKE